MTPKSRRGEKCFLNTQWRSGLIRLVQLSRPRKTRPGKRPENGTQWRQFFLDEVQNNELRPLGNKGDAAHFPIRIRQVCGRASGGARLFEAERLWGPGLFQPSAL